LLRWLISSGVTASGAGRFITGIVSLLFFLACLSDELQAVNKKTQHTTNVKAVKENVLCGTGMVIFYG
jgi:flagellar basal body P-ring protein FlgI